VSGEPATDITQKAVITARGALSPRTIVAIMALVALFGPFAIQVIIDPWDSFIYLLAMTWQWQPDYWNPFWLYKPSTLIGILILSGLRLVFVGMIYRLYKGKTTRKHTIILGIAAELQSVTIFFIPYLIMLLLNPHNASYFPLMFPFPLLLVLGVILFRVSPPPREPSAWRDDDMDEDDEEIEIKMSDRLRSRLESSEGNARA
jgi:hypothetical protein